MNRKCSKADVWNAETLEFYETLVETPFDLHFCHRCNLPVCNQTVSFFSIRPHVQWLLRILAWGRLSFRVTFFRLWFSTNEETPMCSSAKTPLLNLTTFLALIWFQGGLDLREEVKREIDWLCKFLTRFYFLVSSYNVLSISQWVRCNWTGKTLPYIILKRIWPTWATFVDKPAYSAFTARNWQKA